MTMIRRHPLFAATACLLILTGQANAQRRGGGGGGGGAPRGGMVGQRGPVAAPPQFHGSPSFTAPRVERPNIARPNVNAGNVGRQEINRGVRPEVNINIGREEANRGFRPEINNNVNRGRENFNRNDVNVNNRPNNVTNINRVTNINTFDRGPRGGWGGYGGGYSPNPYQPYHAGWVHGSWNNHYLPGGFGGYRGWGGYYGGYNSGYGNYYGGTGLLGLGAGIGIATWGLAALSNSWGYSRYANPYYSGAGGFGAQPGVAATAFYDYSQPLNLTSPPPGEDVINQAVSSLDEARSAFAAGDYPRALQLADQAIARTPNDPMMHEFRAVCLFALGRYDEAAIPLYTVLSAGPGWDWTTLCSLYPDVEVYTQQIRALEDYCNRTPRAASARFVLASLYMAQGNTAAAAAKYREVVAIQPQDKLSDQLAAAVSSAMPNPSSPPVASQAAMPSPDAPPASSQPPPLPTAGAGQPGGNPASASQPPPNQPPLPNGPVPTRMVGSWTATPAKDVTITLAIVPDQGFTWKVNDRGQTRELQGPAKFDNNTLALLAPDQPPMVANVAFKDDGHFHFKPVGAPADDPGLDFVK